jgi:hypothetical protein
MWLHPPGSGYTPIGPSHSIADEALRMGPMA